MLTGDRSGGALNARRMVATLGLAETLTPARRWSESRPGACPCPWGDSIRHLRCQPLLVPPSSRAADRSGTRQMAGRAGRKNGQGCRANDEAGRPASCGPNGLYASCADRGRWVSVGGGIVRPRTQSRRCEPTIKDSGEPMRDDAARPGRRRLKACDRLMRGFEQVTKERSVWRL